MGQEGAGEEGEEEEEIEGMQESTGARMMVEELMLLAGEIADKFAEARGIPVPFRVQQRPSVCVPSSPLSSPCGVVADLARAGRLKIFRLSRAGQGEEGRRKVVEVAGGAAAHEVLVRARTSLLAGTRQLRSGKRHCAHSATADSR